MLSFIQDLKKSILKSVTRCSERHLAKYLDLERDTEVRILRHAEKDAPRPITGWLEISSNSFTIHISSPKLAYNP